MRAAELYIGLMSGTSLDGLDGVLVDLRDCDDARVQVLSHAHCAFDAAFAAELLALNTAGDNELHRAALAGNRLSQIAADLVRRLLKDSGQSRESILAIGAHGQTVRHCPGEFDGTGYSLQLNNPSLLAELTGIDVVADLRSRDVAAGGQGAPLVPAFHRAIFGRSNATVTVLNIGGMSNLTVLHADGETRGFDCGPGNALMDLWASRHLKQAYDAGGRWASGGHVDERLLSRLQSEPFFAAIPPKSTGRDLFNASWLDGHLAALGSPAERDPQDVQSTLTELTAWVCARDIQLHAPTASQLLVCGGGALNAHLMQSLAARLPAILVSASDAAGLPSNQVEAVAFAWLARACLKRQPGNLASVTGANGPRILGAIYPGF